MIDLELRLSRRRLVRVASIATGTLAGGLPVLARAQDLLLRETADQVTGPFYPRVKPADTDTDLTVVAGRGQRAEGQVVRLSGRVLNLKGEPVRDAAVEIWQANTHGRYSHPSDPNLTLPLDPNFEGYAQLRTGPDGGYRITTIKPGPYPTARGDLRAPHIHFQIDGKIDRKVTQLYFPGEALNAEDRHLNSVRRPESLIMTGEPVPQGSVLELHRDIILASG